jgi:hypothetical protein
MKLMHNGEVLYVCPTVYFISETAGQILMKYGIWGVHKRIII